MLKKINKIVILTLILTIVISMNVTYISRAGSVAGELINTLDEGQTSSANDKVKEIVAIIITVVRVVGVAVAIVMLLVVAMKYMSAAPGEKADIKKSAVVYVVGAVVLFAVTGILGLINTFSSNIKTTTAQ